MLPSEPSGRNPLANGTYSDKRSGKLAVQNGECSPIGCAPKYKRRKISAIRDFPPGCGRNAQRTITRPTEEPDVAVANGHENSIGEEGTVGGARNGTPGLSEDLQEVVTATSREELIPILADGKIFLPSNGSVVVSEGNGSENRIRNYPPRRKVSAVRDFPPNCGRNAFRLIVAELAGGCSSPANKSFGPEKSDSGMNDRKTSPEILGIDDRQTRDDVRYGAHKRSETGGTEVTRNAVQPKESDSGMNYKTQKMKAKIDDVQNGAYKRSERGGIEVTQKEVQPKESESGMNDKTLEVTAKTDGKKAVEDVQGGDLYKSRLEKSVSKVISRVVVQHKESVELLVSPKNKSKGKEKFRSEVSDKPLTATVKTYLKRTIDDAQPNESQDAVGSRKKKSFGRGNTKLVTDDKLAVESVNVDLKQTVDLTLDRDSKKSKSKGHVCNGTGDKVQPEGEIVAVEDESGMGVDGEEDEKLKEPSFEEKLYWWDHEFEKVAAKDNNDGGSGHDLGTEKVIDEVKRVKEKQSDASGHCNQIEEVDAENLKLASDRVVEQGGSSEPSSKPPDGTESGRKEKKHDTTSAVVGQKTKMTARKKVDENIRREMSLKKISPKKVTNKGIGELVVCEKGKSVKHKKQEDRVVGPARRSADLYFPSFPSTSSAEAKDDDGNVTRRKVKETLQLYQTVCSNLLQEEKLKSKVEKGLKRIDLKAVGVLKERNKLINQESKILGSVPGVEVGDEFQYRAELNIIGLHRPIQGGIDYMKHKGKIIATSVVASGGYSDDLENSDALIYTGQGGNVMQSGKEPEDQKLERGNLSLKNSVDEKTPVRVVRGCDSADGKSRLYVYDGLYLVKKYWQVVGPHGKLVFQFRLERIPGQPEIEWKEVKKGKKNKTRDGVCVDDISNGKEVFPICAVNTVDDEKPPKFKYITKMVYPDWYNPSPPEGCSCTTKCSDSTECSCAVKNGGEIPFNDYGAIIESKSLVYECGPSCKCSSTCHNRVTQHGLKYQLEIFKTERMGWGVRSLNFIPLGSFVCEYVGELLKEKEAEERTGNDEYLFDIGSHNDNTLWGDEDSGPALSGSGSSRDGCFTIDAAEYGNVGRFINHRCTPNLYAQNVIYDHDDTRIPRIMLFAADNIPPQEELTYHYNYTIDDVRDSNGKIKTKSCFCGSDECTGRLY